jgi:cytoskeletal protein CcmA (bactofilin family)
MYLIPRSQAADQALAGDFALLRPSAVHGLWIAVSSLTSDGLRRASASRRQAVAFQKGEKMMWKKSEPEESQPQSAYTPQAPQAPAQRMPAPQSHSKERAVLGSTISVKGNLTGEEDLVIEGRVEGKIEFPRHSVTVGKNGTIKADIYGKTITVEGNVEGNLYGEEQLVVRSSGTVRGNIVAPRVALEDGSNFKGNIDMSPKEKPGSSTAYEDLTAVN